MNEKELAKEAGQAYSDKLDLKVGDTVKVLFKIPEEFSVWVGNMDRFVGQECKVLGTECEAGNIDLAMEDGRGAFWFPAFCLEVVSRKSDEKMIGDKEFKERAAKTLDDVLKLAKDIESWI